MHYAQKSFRTLWKFFNFRTTRGDCQGNMDMSFPPIRNQQFHFAIHFGVGTQWIPYDTSGIFFFFCPWQKVRFLDSPSSVTSVSTSVSTWAAHGNQKKQEMKNLAMIQTSNGNLQASYVEQQLFLRFSVSAFRGKRDLVCRFADDIHACKYS